MTGRRIASAPRIQAPRRIAACLVALGLALLGAEFAAAAPTGLTEAGCTGAEYRQFDFFLGDWDTFDLAAPSVRVARNRVTPMLDGCALREVYEQGDGLRGESFSLYDAARGVWHQSWVTNRGELLLLDGRFTDGRMTFSARQATTAGATLVRAVWWPEGDSVREKAERSTDDGKTWTLLFDIIFRRHRP